MEPQPLPMTVPAAAERWGMTPSRVRQLIEKGRVTATKAGGVWLVWQSQPPEKLKGGRPVDQRNQRRPR